MVIYSLKSLRNGLERSRTGRHVNAVHDVRSEALRLQNHVHGMLP
jgi:hypothetical protein